MASTRISLARFRSSWATLFRSSDSFSGGNNNVTMLLIINYLTLKLNLYQLLHLKRRVWVLRWGIRLWPGPQPSRLRRGR